jgi:hypothetical protein
MIDDHTARYVATLALEISNIRLRSDGGRQEIDVQIKTDLEPDRWHTTPAAPGTFKSLTEAMKEKRPIYANIRARGNYLVVSGITITFAPSTGRS